MVRARRSSSERRCISASNAADRGNDRLQVLELLALTGVQELVEQSHPTTNRSGEGSGSPPASYHQEMPSPARTGVPGAARAGVAFALALAVMVAALLFAEPAVTGDPTSDVVVRLCLVTAVAAGLVILLSPAAESPRPRARGWLVTGLVGAFLAAGAALVLSGTDFPPLGIALDQGFRAASITKYAHTLALVDFAYKDLPAFYPPLFFWVLGRGAAWLGAEPYEALKLGVLGCAVAAPVAVFALWARLTRDHMLAVAVAIGALAFQDWYEPYAWLAVVVFVPWWLLFVLQVGADRPPRRAVLWCGALIGAAVVLHLLLLLLHRCRAPAARAPRVSGAPRPVRAWCSGPAAAGRRRRARRRGAAQRRLLAPPPGVDRHDARRALDAEPLLRRERRRVPPAVPRVRPRRLAHAPRPRVPRRSRCSDPSWRSRSRRSSPLRTRGSCSGRSGVLVDVPLLKVKTHVAHRRGAPRRHRARRRGHRARGDPLTPPRRPVRRRGLARRRSWSGPRCWCSRSGPRRWPTSRTSTSSAAATEPVASLSTFDRATRDDAADTVVLTDQEFLPEYRPVYVFNVWSAHYSHPAAQFDRRTRFLERLAREQDPEVFAAALRHNRYDDVDWMRAATRGRHASLHVLRRRLPARRQPAQDHLRGGAVRRPVVRPARVGGPGRLRPAPPRTRARVLDAGPGSTPCAGGSPAISQTDSMRPRSPSSRR